MGKYNIYAVAYGKHPETKENVYGLKFENWSEAKQYINNVEGAKYKGFLTEDEADAWIVKKLSELKESEQKEQMNDINKNDEPVIDNKVDSVFTLMCEKLNLDPEEVENKLKLHFIDLHRKSI